MVSPSFLGHLEYTDIDRYTKYRYISLLNININYIVQKAYYFLYPERPLHIKKLSNYSIGKFSEILIFRKKFKFFF